MKNWSHKVSLDWMNARQKFITASDVANLTEKTDTGRKRSRSTIETNYVKMFADKHRVLTEDDCTSTGAAARGHILEPLGVSFFRDKFGVEAYHWDDFLLTRENIGWSPDGMDVWQPPQGVVASGSQFSPSRAFEVKCYYAEKHLATGMSYKMAIPERWQVATAFFVCPTLERMDLILYNPSLDKFKMMVHSYTPSELGNEIWEVQRINEEANDMFAQIESSASIVEVALDKQVTEEEIYADWREKQRGNVNPY